MTATRPRAVLAYGTLRPGFGNHGLVARFDPDAEDVTVPGFRMYALGRNFTGFPYVWPDPDPDAAVRATLLTFPESDWLDALARMDRLEGVPWHYNRHLVPFRRDDGTTSEAWIYVPVEDPRGDRHPLVPSGDWTDRPAVNRYRGALLS